MISAKQSPIHRWYRITEMLPISLVRELVRSARGAILEPFVGVGTVLVEAKRAGIRAVGVDANPFMCFASAVKIREYDSVNIKAALDDVLSNRFRTVNTKPPPIFNLDRYYNCEALEKLIILKDNICRLKDRRIRDVLTLCFLKAAVDAANIKKSPAPRFITSKESLPIFTMFESNVGKVLEDLRSCESSEDIEICLGDSRDIGFLRDSFDLVITSPPYCNNVDYVRHTQLELYWLGYVRGSEDLGKLRRRSITSCEAMAHVGKDDSCQIDNVHKLAEAIGGRTDRAFPRVIIQYFAGMQSHLEGLRDVLKPTSRAFYIIGDSWIKGIYIPTHELLAQIVKSVGFSRVDLQFLRAREAPRGHKFGLSEYLLTISP